MVEKETYYLVIWDGSPMTWSDADETFYVMYRRPATLFRSRKSALRRIQKAIAHWRQITAGRRDTGDERRWSVRSVRVEASGA